MRQLVAFLLALPALAGCLGAGDPLAPAAGGDPLCAHPWPCEGAPAWPDSLEGPFARLAPQRVRVASFDGTVLDGWVWRPDVPPGVRVPVVLVATPYPGQCPAQRVLALRPTCVPAADDPAHLEGRDRLGALVDAGHAVAIVNVRGTGFSGGCFDFWGPAEQRDMVALVGWAAAEPWSNGRVGMMGLSYAGTTPWEAAIQAPPALKTIVVGGTITDVYTTGFTPQGAGDLAYGGSALAAAGGIGVAPPLVAAVGPGLLGWLGLAPERLCPGVASALAAFPLAEVADERAPAFFEARRFLDRVPDVTAAVFVAQGFHEGLVHGFQEDVAWEALEHAPKRMLLGQWGHTFPGPEELDAYPDGAEWPELLVPWMDYWLKGVGDAEALRLGTVDHQGADGAWRSSAAWPPAEARDEVLFLVDDALAPRPAPGARSFRGQPAVDPFFCEDAVPENQALIYAGAPLPAPATLAGNPMAHLRLSSDLPRGMFSVHLYDLGPAFACDDHYEDSTWITGGAIDLRFHDGNYVARDFPVGAPTDVRVDLLNAVATIPAGHRLGLILQTDTGWRSAPPGYPRVTVHGGDGPDASHLVLPLVEGSLGGAAPVLVYPPRPFGPVRT